MTQFAGIILQVSIISTSVVAAGIVVSLIRAYLPVPAFTPLVHKPHTLDYWPTKYIGNILNRKSRHEL